MKIVYNALPTHCRGGGGVVKLRKLRQYLSARGHTVDLFDPWQTEIADYDIYHHFSWYTADLPVIRYAKAEGAKVVLETMYWDSLSYALRADAPNWLVRGRGVARYLLKRLAPRLYPQRRVLLEADLLMANSHIEADLLVRHFRLDERKVLVAYNGVDRAFRDADPKLFIDRYGVSDFVLATGMFEARKNQLTLIRALRDTGIPLVLVGSCPAVHRWYYDLCRREAGDNVTFVPPLDHDDPLLASAYAASRALAIPSWHETTGKSALEAALAGKHVIMTTYAPGAREYFGDLATYVDPGNEGPIRDAIVRLMGAAPNPALRDRMEERFLWDIVAAGREAGYETLFRGAKAADGGMADREPTSESAHARPRAPAG